MLHVVDHYKKRELGTAHGKFVHQKNTDKEDKRIYGLLNPFILFIRVLLVGADVITSFNVRSVYTPKAGLDSRIKPAAGLDSLSFIIIGTRKERIRPRAWEIRAQEEHG